MARTKYPTGIQSNRKRALAKSRRNMRDRVRQIMQESSDDVSLNIPILNFSLSMEIDTIKDYVRGYIQSKRAIMEERKIGCNNLLMRLIRGNEQEFSEIMNMEFGEFLDKYVFTQDRVEKVREYWVKNEGRAEEVLDEFVIDFLIKHFQISNEQWIPERNRWIYENNDWPIKEIELVERGKRQLPNWHFALKLEARCLECDSIVDQEHTIPLNRPVHDSDLIIDEMYPFENRRYAVRCTNDSSHQTRIISSKNIIVVDSVESVISYFEWRLKSAGESIQKVLETILGYDDFGDQIGARIVVRNSGDPETDKERIWDILEQVVYHYHVPKKSPVCIELKELDMNLDPIHENGERHSVERNPRYVKAYIPLKGKAVRCQLQVMTEQWYNEMERTEELEHSAYIERREREREGRRRNDPYYAPLEERLKRIIQ